MHIIHVEQCAVEILKDYIRACLHWLKTLFHGLSVAKYSETAEKWRLEGEVEQLLWGRWSEEEKEHIWSELQ